MSHRPQVTFLIATYNRREVLLHTLERVKACMSDPIMGEVVVIDNASTDGTAQAVRERFPEAMLLQQAANRGPCAKNAGLAAARGEFVVFLDDDSFPMPGSVERMIQHFAARPRLGAAIFTITLPDGRQECSAYPNICIGCGTGFRRKALQAVGGLPDDFFMAAEEYDLSLRLLDAEWDVESFDDLHVTHMKTPMSRFPSRVARLDARNNILLALRYFPEPWHWRYAREWSERYRLIAAANGTRTAFWRGMCEGVIRGVLAPRRRPISADAFERFARIREIRASLHDATERLRLRKVLFVDLGKNVFAYWLAAKACGLEVVAIADSRLGSKHLRYRGVPIVSDAEATRLPHDAAIISDLSLVHIRQRLSHWRQLDWRPVIDLLENSPIEPAKPLAA